MNTTDRAERLAEIAAELLAITTAEEQRIYPFAEHLADLIADLELEPQA